MNRAGRKGSARDSILLNTLRGIESGFQWSESHMTDTLRGSVDRLRDLVAAPGNVLLDSGGGSSEFDVELGELLLELRFVVEQVLDFIVELVEPGLVLTHLRQDSGSGLVFRKLRRFGVEILDGRNFSTDELSADGSHLT